MNAIKVVPPVVEGLPKGCVLEHFGQIDAKTYFVVFGSPDHDFSKFRVAIGPVDGLFEVKVKKVNRYTDTHTVIIETEGGEFSFPNPARTGIKGYHHPTFNRKPVIASFTCFM